jgi:hypothetical protein
LSTWSRARLAFSILTCEGLFATLRERMQYAPPPERLPVVPDRVPELGLPRCYDYAGALHVHSTYSDGIGTVSQIAQAGNEAGLDFVLLCDHSSLEAQEAGEDTWHGRTLIMVGAEITTLQGHLLALNVPDSFLPVSDDAETAQRAIQECGGFGFIALPCDLKDHWCDFSQRWPGIGLEIFNMGAIARTKINLLGLVLIWVRYHSERPQRAFHLVASRPSSEIHLWDRLTAPPLPGQPAVPVVGIGSVDAHAVMRFGGRDYPYPTYTQIFRTMRTHIVTPQPFSYTESSSDRAIVHQALAAGHCYMSYDNYADPTGFTFEASPLTPNVEEAPAMMGDSVVLGRQDSSCLLTIQVPRTRSLTRLYHNGRLVKAARGGRLTYHATLPGVYRAEVYLYQLRIGNVCLGAKPWIFSNPIYLQPSPVLADSVLGTDSQTTASLPQHP